MSQRKYEQGKANPLAANPLVAMDEATYGVPGIPDSGRLIARRLPIEEIAPDPAQPRRLIPAVVHAAATGSEITALLAAWHSLSEVQGLRIPIRDLLRGAEMEATSQYPLAQEFMDLVRLAISIGREGLLTPIQVVRRGGGYVIESGERRWAAFHLLLMATAEEKWATIPALEKPRVDVWAQAAENGARKPLNAIGMARQLALLIMDMYVDERGVKFDSYEDLVGPRQCDRAFYAQVRRGETWPVKRGMTERVLQVTGLKSTKQISDYRALLDIPDALWMKADEQGWTEGAIREYMQEARSVNTVNALPIGNAQPKATPAAPALPAGWPTVAPPAPALRPARGRYTPMVGDVVELVDGTRGTVVILDAGNVATVELGDRSRRTMTQDKLTLVTRASASLVVTPAAPRAEVGADNLLSTSPVETAVQEPAAPVAAPVTLPSVPEPAEPVAALYDEGGIEASVHPTTPLIDEWTAQMSGRVEATLKGLMRAAKAYGHDGTVLRLREMATMSRADLAKQAGSGDVTDDWASYLDDVALRAELLLNAQQKALQEYLAHVYALRVELQAATMGEAGGEDG